MPGYGKVAIAAMMPILSSMGYSICNLPTALISNTLDYGKFEIHDTTDYMRNTIEVWSQLNFSFDCICTGFISSSKQVDIINDFIKKNQSKGILAIVDPIMGDYGKLYHGIPDSRVSDMRKLVKNADISIPNFTEASFLCDFYAGCDKISSKDVRTLITKMQEIGSKSVVITSVDVEAEEKHLVCGYDHNCDEYFQFEYEHIPVKFPGTGDIFSAVLTGNILRDNSLSVSVKKAMDVVKFLIENSRNTQDSFKGIFIEKFIHDIDKI